MDKAAAAGRLAAREARKAARDGSLLVEERYSDSPDYQAMRQGLGRARHMALESTAQALDDLGRSRWGASTGTGARTAAEALSHLPVITVIGDTVRARHGVDDLAERLRADPSDATVAVHLAEAMQRCEADMTTYTRFRSATSLTYALRQKLVASTLALGVEGDDGSRSRLLRAAHSRVAATLASNPGDRQALELMARILLLSDSPSDAAVMAKLSVLADRSNGHGWVTLARAYLALGQFDNAVQAGQRAVDCGCSFGYDPIATASLQLAAPSRDAIRAYERTRGMVADSDRREYLGYSAGTWTVVDSIFSKQTGRYQDLMNQGALT